MGLFLQTGPGHHEHILINQLKKSNQSFKYSTYHPKFEIRKFENQQDHLLKSSIVFEFVKWLIWGVSNRLPFLRRENRHINFLYYFYDLLNSKFLRSETNLIFAWAQVCKITFANNAKALKILDYPIPHIKEWQRILTEESSLINKRHLHSIFSNSMVDRMLKEIEEADLISVPSPFVRDSFLKNGIPENKIIFNPYGIDSEYFKPSLNKTNNEKLHVIFIGSIEYRKGVHYLLKATEPILDQIELIMIGTVHSDFVKEFDQYKSKINWLGQQNREQVLANLHRADVMVMPSLVEGLSLTILEAMSSGVPVISTTNAGGIGVIEDKIDGFIVPIRDPDALCKSIIWSMNNRHELKKMGEKARGKILNGYTKELYFERFTKLVLNRSNE